MLNVVSNGAGSKGLVISGSGNTITVTLNEDAPSYQNVVGPATYNVTETDYYISCDPTAGAITINLPDAPDLKRQFIVKDRTGQAATHSITVKSLTGASTIDLMSTYVFTDNFESLEMLYYTGNYEGF